MFSAYLFPLGMLNLIQMFNTSDLIRHSSPHLKGIICAHMSWNSEKSRVVWEHSTYRYIFTRDPTSKPFWKNCIHDWSLKGLLESFLLPSLIYVGPVILECPSTLQAWERQTEEWDFGCDWCNIKKSSSCNFSATLTDIISHLAPWSPWTF